MPWVCPGLVAGLTWSWIYEPNFGPLNYFLRQLGVIDHNVGWLSRSETAMYAAIVMGVWKLLPFMVVMLLAGLQAVPPELYEASTIDGAGIWGRFRYITFPLLNRVGSIAVLLAIIGEFNTFDTVYGLTRGGPANSTILLSLMAYENAFRFFQIGYSSAIGVVMLLTLLLPMTVYIRRIMQEV